MNEAFWHSMISAATFSVMGLVILFLCFWLIEKITPENLWKEIIHNKNVALAIMAAALILAVAIIISSSIHGG